MQSGESLPYETLQDYVPRSNWQRYFAILVDCEDQYLKVRWEELYKLRCKIAHNAQFEKSDYERVCELTDEINPKLRDAVEKVTDVVVPQDEKDNVAENAVTSIYPSTGEFIHLWREFESRISAYANQINIDPKNPLSDMQFPHKVYELRKRGLLTNEFVERVRAITVARNGLLHSGMFIVDESMISQMINDVNLLLKELDNVFTCDVFES